LLKGFSLLGFFIKQIQKSLMQLNKLLLTATLLLTPIYACYAWQHEVSLGYGFGREVEKDYQNTAFVLSGKLYKFPKIDNTLIATIDGSVSQLRADTDVHRHLTTAALALGLRAYFQNPDLHQIRPYLGVSSGPSYLSSRYFGTGDQGAHLDLQSTIESGVEFELKNKRSVDVNLHFVHYCNAGLAYPNLGFNVPFVIAVGYQF
jgi:hypothetical protein